MTTIDTMFEARGVAREASRWWWVFLLSGIARLVFSLVIVTVAFVTKPEFELWWLQLIVGLLEIGLAFWVAGNFRNKVILLVVYTGVVALSKGITDLFLAFEMRSVHRVPDTV